MCGIWAHIGASEISASVNKEIAQKGTDAVNMRGPDGVKILAINTNAGALLLGHRRLAIYDTSEAGAQPMTRGPLTIVFNGALYNFKEVRENLVARGQKFETQTDTETLLAAWLLDGVDCLSKFDGMFAIALYDARDQSLWLARDRFGEKPLHIFEGQNSIAFASEIQQFIAAGLLNNAKLNKKVAKDFIDLGIAEQGEKTFFEGVRRLGIGQYLTYDLSQSAPKLIKYGSIFARRMRSDNSLDGQSAAAQLRTALELSIKRRLGADVKVGSCLSGGIDSSAIVRIASNMLPNGETFECFCAVFDETDAFGQNISEREFAVAAANRDNLNLNIVSFDGADIKSQIENIITRQGEPFAHSSIIAQYKVFEAAKQKGVKVMLDGQGADELFGGYSGMLGHRLADCLLQEGFGAWQTEISAFAADGAELNEIALKKATFNALLPETLRRNIARLRGRWPQEFQATKGEISLAPNKLPSIDRFESLIRNLQDSQSLPGLLRYEDRNSMSFGIETRLPFLSLEVADLANQIPSKLKAENGWSKAVLRNAVADILPQTILARRRKLGFITPQDRWLGSELKAWAIAGIDFANSRFAQMFDQQKIANIRGNIGLNPAANSVGFRIACLGHWAEMFNVEY